MIVDTVLNIINKFIPDTDQQEKIKLELKKEETNLEQVYAKYANIDHELRMKEIDTTGFKATWRPFLMFGFGSIVMLYSFIYYILPAILAVLGIEIDSLILLDPPKIDPALWDLVKFSILGIGGMRTVDKWRIK